MTSKKLIQIGQPQLGGSAENDESQLGERSWG